LFPSFDSSEDATRIGGPDEGFWTAIGGGDEALMACFSSSTDRKVPRCSRRRVSLAKNPSTALSQKAEVGVKWKVQRGCQPGAHLRVFVGGLIVDDGVDGLSFWHLRLDGV
jgi:hypothetical protein